MANLRWEDRQDGRWIYLAGELDHVGHKDLASRFSAAVGEAHGVVVVDLAGVTFAGSLTVTMLLKARANPHIALFLTGLTPHLRTMFEAIGVLPLIPERNE